MNTNLYTILRNSGESFTFSESQIEDILKRLNDPTNYDKFTPNIGMNTVLSNAKKESLIYTIGIEFRGDNYSMIMRDLLYDDPEIYMEDIEHYESLVNDFSNVFGIKVTVGDMEIDNKYYNKMIVTPTINSLKFYYKPI